jgi:hypothetical protein
MRAHLAGGVLWLALAWPALCHAQAPAAAQPASAAASSAAGAASAASAAAGNPAMERAQRAADSPLRAIMEAGKIRGRIQAEAVETPEPRRAPARANDVPPRPAPGAAPAPVAAAAVAAAGAPAQPAAPAPRPAAEPEPALRTLPTAAAGTTLPRANLDNTAVAPLTLPRAAAVPAGAELPSVQALPESAQIKPRLVRMIEPEVSPRALEQLTRPEVTVEFTIGADGAVSAIAVLPPVPRGMVGPIVSAVEQWRFAPLPAPRVHRVQLVFNAGR